MGYGSWGSSNITRTASVVSRRHRKSNPVSTRKDMLSSDSALSKMASTSGRNHSYIPSLIEDETESSHSEISFGFSFGWTTIFILAVIAIGIIILIK